MTLSRESLELFDHLLRQQNLNVGAEDFEETAERVLTAKRELAEELADG